ncbi:MAG: hypothetical protein ABR599_06695 [Gemmatimonadota bacterium]
MTLLPCVVCPPALGRARFGRLRRRALRPVLGGLLLAACSEAPPPATDAGGLPPEGGAAALPADSAGGAGAPRAPQPSPGGTGFLDRQDVSVRMAGQGLIIDVVAMNAEVLALATDDLRTYLQEALKKVPDSVPADLRRDGTYFLVGFSSQEKEISFEPSQVHLDSEGRRYFPRYIVPVSAGFDARVLPLFTPVWGVYVFDPGIDLVSTLEFGYRDELSTRGAWRSVVQNVEEARGRAHR